MSSVPIFFTSEANKGKNMLDILSCVENLLGRSISHCETCSKRCHWAENALLQHYSQTHHQKPEDCIIKVCVYATAFVHLDENLYYESKIILHRYPGTKVTFLKSSLENDFDVSTGVRLCRKHTLSPETLRKWFCSSVVAMCNDICCLPTELGSLVIEYTF